MLHRFKSGDPVYFHGQFGDGAKSIYKVIRTLPVERDTVLRYRIKNPAETFERTATEEQLTREP